MKAKILLIFVLIVEMGNAQYPERKKNPYHTAYHDSLKAMDYPYTFPLLGKKAYKKGFDIPFAWGIGPTMFSMRQEILITRTAIAFNNSPLVDLTDFIQFGKITTKGTFFTLRPDLWVLPFLNVYGIFGAGSGTTEVPLVEPVVFTTEQKSDGKSLGAGFTIAGGLGGVIIIIDNNFNWASTEKLTEPVPAYTLDARIGHNFVNPRRADRTLTVWVGAFFQSIKADTKGVIQVKDLFPDASTDEIRDKIERRLDEWSSGLPPGQQVVVEQIIQKIKDHFAGLDPGNGQIIYELDKKIAGPWNMILGAQYQHNKNWMIRSEVGTFGKRSQFLLSLNYRFQSFRKKSVKH